MGKKPELTEKDLNTLGFDFLDLGTDFNSKNHLYYVFPKDTDAPIGNCIFDKEGIEILLAKKG